MKKVVWASIAMVSTSLWAAVPAAVDSVPAWKVRLNALVSQPASPAQDLALAFVRCELMEDLARNDPDSPEFKRQQKACTLQLDVVESRTQTAALRARTDSLWKMRLTVQKEIVAIQQQIIEIETGKASNLAADLEAEKQRLARASAASAEEKERLRREAADRESLLKGELEEKERLLAEERRKAEERQDDARRKLDALQSKLINVHKDARGIILSMSDILFDVNKASLTADLKTNLARIAGILMVYGESNIIVEGHTDNTGGQDLNQKLSEQRAANVKQFLTEQGVDASRLRSEGFGFSRPIGDNTTSEGRQKNRRVDLVIQDKSLQ